VIGLIRVLVMFMGEWSDGLLDRWSAAANENGQSHDSITPVFRFPGAWDLFEEDDDSRAA